MKEVVYHITEEDRKDICDLMLACTNAELSANTDDIEKWHKLHNKLSCILSLIDFERSCK